MHRFSSALENDLLIEILKQSSDATAIYTGSDIKIQLANDAMLKIWGKDESVNGKALEEALPELKGQPFTGLLKNAWNTGEVFEATDMAATMEIKGVMVTSYFDFIYKPIKNSDGKVYCILHTATNVTERVKAWQLVREKEEKEQRINEELAASNEEYQATNEELNATNELLLKTYERLSYTENRIQEVIKTTPVGLAILKGYDMVIEAANPMIQTIWGTKVENIIGKPLLEIFPLLKGQEFLDQLDLAYASGNTVSLPEITFNPSIENNQEIKYLTVNLHPLSGTEGSADSIMVTVMDITEKVLSRKILEKNELILQEYIEELAVLNEELHTSNEALTVLNEEYIATNEQLEQSNQTIYLLNKQLNQENEHLGSDNKGHLEKISHLTVSNYDLDFRNKELKELNNMITELNSKLSESEKSFGHLISQAPVAMMLIKGEDLIITMINAAMLKILGKTADIIGKPLFKEIPELKDQHVAMMFRETFKSGQPCSDHSIPVLLKRNGTTEKGFFNFNYTPFLEDGKITGVIDMAVEVTPQVLAIEEREKIILEKTQLEETLRNSEQRLHGILETMAEGVGVIDAKGQLVYANPMAQQILGLTEDLIKERTYHDHKWQNLRLDGSTLPLEEHPMSIMLNTGKPVYDHEIGVQPPEGERLYISINAAPIFDTDGNITGGIGTFMDVTSRRMITQGKDDFISIASHELKTPVTALKASLQLLQRSHKKLPAESMGRLLDQSVKSLDKLSNLIKDLLDTSRIDQGHIKLHKHPFTLEELFTDCCSNLVKNARQKIIFKGDLTQVVEADNQQVGQVMINFITNALKYAPDSPEIIITAAKVSENEIKISVKDHGPGIPKQKLAHLFERYYRTNYEGEKFTGLGLGLYISADIIKKHGGKVGAESELEKGSEFWFTLPLQ